MYMYGKCGHSSNTFFHQDLDLLFSAPKIVGTRLENLYVCKARLYTCIPVRGALQSKPLDQLPLPCHVFDQFNVTMYMYKHMVMYIVFI